MSKKTKKTAKMKARAQNKSPLSRKMIKAVNQARKSSRFSLEEKQGLKLAALARINGVH